MKTLNVFVNPDSDAAAEAYAMLRRCASVYNIALHEKWSPENCDPIVTIGGDGTMIRALNTYPDNPVLGINTGTLGFLTEVDANEGAMLDAMERISNGRFEEERAHRLVYTIERPQNKMPSGVEYETIDEGFAINDIVVARNCALDGINFSVRVNGHIVNRIFADGYVVASPVGASAYALSCGGPLVQPSADVLVLSAIAPHSLVNRSMVIDGLESTVTIEIERLRNPQVKAIACADGVNAVPLQPFDKIEVKVDGGKYPSFIRFNSNRFFDRVSRRLCK